MSHNNFLSIVVNRESLKTIKTREAAVCDLPQNSVRYDIPVRDYIGVTRKAKFVVM